MALGAKFWRSLEFGSGAGNVSRQRLPRDQMFSHQFGGGYKSGRRAPAIGTQKSSYFLPATSKPFPAASKHGSHQQ
jgi:hypothetical protein